MTSNPAECFVYITLPGDVSAITAGKFVLEETRQGDPLGRFVYGKSYLDNPRAVPIDPIELKLSGITYETVRVALASISASPSPRRRPTSCRYSSPDM